MTETRTVSSTGGAKGTKPERYDLIPVGPLRAVARHYGAGAEKYEDRNWERGYEWSKSYAALQRHANAFWDGEDLDPETQSPHLAAVIFHAMSMLEWGSTHPEFDDRPHRSRQEWLLDFYKKALEQDIRRESGIFRHTYTPGDHIIRGEN